MLKADIIPTLVVIAAALAPVAVLSVTQAVSEPYAPAYQSCTPVGDADATHIYLDTRCSGDPKYIEEVTLWMCGNDYVMNDKRMGMYSIPVINRCELNRVSIKFEGGQTRDELVEFPVIPKPVGGKR